MQLPEAPRLEFRSESAIAVGSMVLAFAPNFVPAVEKTRLFFVGGSSLDTVHEELLDDVQRVGVLTARPEYALRLFQPVLLVVLQPGQSPIQDARCLAPQPAR